MRILDSMPAIVFCMRLELIVGYNVHYAVMCDNRRFHYSKDMTIPLQNRGGTKAK